jgi:hypothetical protein
MSDTNNRMKGKSMKFLITRASLGPVSEKPPCKGAIRGPESGTWPGEFEWYIEVPALEDLLAFLNENGGSLGLFSPEEGEEYPVIEIFDDDEEDDDEDE